MLPDNGYLFNGVLRLRLFNNPFASCSFINLYFFTTTCSIDIPHNIGIPFPVFITFESTLSVSFLHFKQYVNMFYNELKILCVILFPLLSYYVFVWKILIYQTYN